MEITDVVVTVVGREDIPAVLQGCVFVDLESGE